jgi:CHAT domain-containing protein
MTKKLTSCSRLAFIAGALALAGHASAQSTPVAGTAAGRSATASPELAQALAAEASALEAAARVQADHRRSAQARPMIEAIQKRIAERLKRRVDREIILAVHNELTRLAFKNASKAMAPMQALMTPPPPDVARELAGEQAAIRAAAAQSPKQAEPAIAAIVTRVATRTRRPAGDPSLYAWVVQAVQTARVMTANAPGGAVYNALPASLRSAVDGSMTQGFMDLGKVDALVTDGKVDEAVRILRQNFSQSDQLTGLTLGTGTAGMAAQGLKMTDSLVDLAQSVARRAPNHAGAVETAFAEATLRKARLLEVERQIGAGLAGTSTDAVRTARATWSTTRALIAEIEFQRAYGIAPSDTQTQDLTKLRALDDSVQKQLAGQAKASRTADASYDLNNIVPSLRRALPPGERLVSYVRHGGFSQANEARYAAYVLDDKTLSFVDLGLAAPIDAAVDSYLDALDRLDGTPASIQQKLALAHAVYTAAFAPLESRLAGAPALHVAGDGSLQLVPFAALHDGNDWLLGRYVFSYVNSERELMSSWAPPGSPAPPIVMAWSPSNSSPPPLKRDKRLAPGDLPALPGVSREAQVVSALLPQSRVLDGAAASDWTWQKVRAPSIVHIAAHGLFLGGSDQPAGGRGLALVPREKPVAKAPLAPAIVENAKPATTATRTGGEGVDPLIRSALVLNPNATPPTDGFLTAYEVATTDLFGTELAVLSACETGRGGVSRIEGVRGMRAAFFAAGVQSLVASLWHVQDEPTVNLMRDFYGNLAKKLGRRDALQQAMLAARKRSADPSTWAAFVLLGHTGPLVAFGATPTPNRAVADESAAARAARSSAFARMESGRSNPGTGSWRFGTSGESLEDSYVEGRLGPQRNNLRINLVGQKTAISFFVLGYRGAGSYRIGPGGVQAALGFKSKTDRVDASRVDPNTNMNAISDGTLTLSGGGTAPLVGRFSLKLGKSEIPGTFSLPRDE